MSGGVSRALVTGGCGFIGSHIVDALQARGAEVVVLDNLSTGDAANIRPGRGVTLVRGDVRDEGAVRGAMAGCDAVFHEAALVSVLRSVEDPGTTDSVNVGGTLQVLTAAKDAGVKRFIYASSSSVYGETPTLPKVETMEPKPVSPYAVSKLAAENYCRVFASVYGLKTVSLRYFNVYGPRQKPGPYSGVIPTFFKSALTGERPVVFGDGEQTRDFTFVKDAVQANMLALDGPVRGGEVFNVGSHSRTSILKLADAVCRSVGREGLGVIHAPPRAGDVRHSFADIGAISGALGYRPAYGLEAGIAEIARTYENPGAGPVPG